ncbi:MAG: protease inhibitor I42 family protein [Candidatus Margulisbacteria bacterium]|nr:protease inhibitor I42 family protein [Candidatus Margulisiibacteriota bacterium]
MKRILAASFLLFVIFLLVGCNGSGPSDATYRLIVGEELTIKLDSNPTTGYSWHIDGDFNKRVVSYEGSEYLEPDTSRLGAGGQEAFKFRAAGKGKTNIKMKYFRTWDPKSGPVERKVYTVIVTE